MMILYRVSLKSLYT